MLASVRDLLRETDYGLVGNFGRYEQLAPFDVWLCETATDRSWYDDETGDACDWHYWAARIGRRIITVTSPGFHYVDRYPTEEEAAEVFAGMTAEYDAFSSDDETEEVAP